MLETGHNGPKKLAESQFSLSFRTKSCTANYNAWQNEMEDNTTFINYMIRELTRNGVYDGQPAKISEKDLLQLNSEAIGTMWREAACMHVELDQSWLVVGDLFGRYDILSQLFTHFGSPAKQRYIFLGNYIDRGRRSIEVISLLLAYKIKYPKNIYLLRGNHECEYTSRHYGFYRECTRRFRVCIWHAFIRTFMHLPGAVVVGQSVFCCHSGLWPDFDRQEVTSPRKLVDFLADNIRLPISVSDNSLLANLAWSEPRVETVPWHPNPSGKGMWFSEDVVADFCTRTGISIIIRSNESHELGYELCASGQMLTVNPVPCLVGNCITLGAVARLELQTGHANSVVKVGIELIRTKTSLSVKTPLKWDKVYFNYKLNSIELQVAEGQVDIRDSLMKSQARELMKDLD